MAHDILLKGGSVDILIRDGFILGTGRGIPFSPGTEVIDCAGALIIPGLVDAHVHFREPGQEYKETIRTGSLAAARGGYTTVCTMPNLDPVPDSAEHIAIQRAIIDRDAVIRVLPYAAITVGRKGREPVDMQALKPLCCAFSDDGSGVQDGDVMLQAMRRAAGCGCIIAAHCEDESLLPSPESEWGQIARDLALAEQTGCRYHVCHISTRRSVELIRGAKARGVKVTCETAPHYLCLCREEIPEDSGRFKMNPPLRTADDREALTEGLADGTIDIIATDHAPHSAGEKSKGLAGSANGIVGLETAFPVLYTHLVLTGKISLDRLVEAMSTAPRRIFGIGGGLVPGAPADIAVIDTLTTYTIDSRDFASKGKSTPFEGWEVRGKVLATFKDGKKLF